MKKVKSLVESKTREYLLAVFLLGPATLLAYFRSNINIIHSLLAFLSIFSAGLIIILLHYNNKIKVYDGFILIVDFRGITRIKYDDKKIKAIKICTSIFDFLTYTNCIKIETIENTYTIYCVTNPEEIINRILHALQIRGLLY